MTKHLTAVALSAVSLLSFPALATERPFLEVGVGVEYGGLGTQIYVPLPLDDVDIYLAAGIFSYSSRTNEEYGFGAGFNYYLEKHHSVNFYYGVLNEDSFLNDQLEVEREYDYGFSVGYKYYFSGRKKSGFTLGATFNIYDDDTYPMISLGYRY